MRIKNLIYIRYPMCPKINVSKAALVGSNGEVITTTKRFQRCLWSIFWCEILCSRSDKTYWRNNSVSELHLFCFINFSIMSFIFTMLYVGFNGNDNEQLYWICTEKFNKHKIIFFAISKWTLFFRIQRHLFNFICDRYVVTSECDNQGRIDRIYFEFKYMHQHFIFQNLIPIQ